MKKITLFLFLIVFVLPFSCKDEDLAPIATFDGLGKGAFPRIITKTTAEYDIRSLSSSKFEYTVDFKDVSQGAEVAKYDIYASFKDNTGGSSSKEEKLWKSFSPSDFSAKENGNLGISVSIPYTEISSFLGLTDADMKYGDVFNFRTTVTTKDGVEFGSGNAAPEVVDNLFGFFDYKIALTCPLGERFTGSYTVSYESAPTSALGAPFGATPGTVTMKATSSSVRTCTLKAIDGKNVTVTLTFACDEIRMGKITTSKTCGQGKLSITQSATTPFTFDSDGSFKLTLTDYASNGGCRDTGGNLVQPTPFTLVFTKG